MDDDAALALRLQLEFSLEASASDDALAAAIRASEAADACEAVEALRVAKLQAAQEMEGAAMAAEIERLAAGRENARAARNDPMPVVTSGADLHDAGSAKISASIFTAHLVVGVGSSDAADAALATMRASVRTQQWCSRVVGMPWAYRTVGTDGMCRCACDDDGEFGAGGKLAQLLDSCKATNVLIGVTRQGERLPHCSQFSLTKFGQHRWPHFVGCARALLGGRGQAKSHRDRCGRPSSARKGQGTASQGAGKRK